MPAGFRPALLLLLSAVTVAAPQLERFPTLQLHVAADAPGHAPSALAAAPPLRSACHCRPSLPADGLCQLSHATVAVAGAPQPSLERRVRAHLGAVPALRVALAAELPLSCAEHAALDEVAGAWGGDAGALVLAAAAVERVAARALRDGEVARLVRAFLTKMRAPYLVYHTNASAQLALQRRLGLETLDMLAPPPGARARILAAFADDPDTHGCVLLRTLLRAAAPQATTASPAAAGEAEGEGAAAAAGLGVQPRLVLAVVAALHAVLWDEGDALRARIRYYVHATPVGERARHGSARGAAQATASPPPAGAPRAVPVELVSIAGQLPDGSLAAPAAAVGGGDASSRGSDALMPYGPFTGVLTLPRGSSSDGGAVWSLALGAAARNNGSAATASSPGIAPPPRALLRVSVSPDCAKLGRGVPIAPFIPRLPHAGGQPGATALPAASPPAAAADGGSAAASAAPSALAGGHDDDDAAGASFYVMHPQVITAHRAALAPLIATAFKLDGSLLLAAMEELGEQWDAAVERELGIGEAALPKVTVLLA